MALQQFEHQMIKKFWMRESFFKKNLLFIPSLIYLDENPYLKFTDIYFRIFTFDHYTHTTKNVLKRALITCNSRRIIFQEQEMICFIGKFHHNRFFVNSFNCCSFSMISISLLFSFVS